MKRIYGQRLGPLAYFGMDYRFRPLYLTGPEVAFRIGDRAAAYIWLGDWRKRNPGRKLIVIEDSVSPSAEHSRFLPGWWLFSDIADELWVLDGETGLIPQLTGESLYHVSMWTIWRWLRTNNCFCPSLKPTRAAYESARAKVEKLRIPDSFVTVQPLFDAKYDRYRNMSPKWWQSLCKSIATRHPVVVIGSVSSSKLMAIPEGVYPAWECGLNPMESLALISQAKAHVGGCTGTTLWSSIFRVPTLAVYRTWADHPKKRTDSRPISFGSPVVWFPLDLKPEEVVRYIDPFLR